MSQECVKRVKFDSSVSSVCQVGVVCQVCVKWVSSLCLVFVKCFKCVKSLSSVF